VIGAVRSSPSVVSRQVEPGKRSAMNGERRA
jgi:hypothetical protein